MTENVAGRVLLEREGELAWVTLSHPGRLNAITVGMWQALRHVFERIAADAAVRCVIVRGEGGNFAAGADIREFPAQRADMAGAPYHREVLAPPSRWSRSARSPWSPRSRASAWAAAWRSPASATCASPAPGALRRADQPPGFPWRSTKCAASLALPGAPPRPPSC